MMGVTDELKTKVGPFPVWVWGTMGAIGFGAYLILLRPPTRTSSSDTSTTTTQQGLGQPPGGVTANGENLTLIENQLNEVMARLNGYGQGAGGTASDTPSDTALAYSAQIASTVAGYSETNKALLDQEWAKLAARTDYTQEQKDTKFRDVSVALANNLQDQIHTLMANVHAYDPQLSQTDASYIRHQTEYAITGLNNQYGNFQNNYALYGNWTTGSPLSIPVPVSTNNLGRIGGF